jgi:glutamine---fructose-6-phosphate transaminase (isomerizing)
MAGEKRTAHPYFMYDAVQAQPDAFARLVRDHAATVDKLGEIIASCDRLYMVGTGTSGHAAQVGEQLMRAYGGGMAARAYGAFDFALYGPALTGRDFVLGISHRGTKSFTVQSLTQARDAGCRTALVTGEGGSAQKAPADVVIETVPQEISATHTISYIGALAVLAALAASLGRRRTGGITLEPDVLAARVPAALRDALKRESLIGAWARAQCGRRRIWIVGGGPGAITAAEVALKIKEASYLQAEGMAIETMLHGPFQCAEPDDLFVLIAPAGRAQPRIEQFAAMITEIGAAWLAVSDGTAETPPHGLVGRCDVPALPEPLTALSCLVPLQLFAYHLALARGTNPDVFRLDDARFSRAYAGVRL